MGKTMIGPETEMQLVPVDIGFCETQTCRGERAAFAVWRPDTSIGNRYSLCKKCAHELVQNLPDELVEEVLGSAEEIDEENGELSSLVDNLQVLERKRYNVIKRVLDESEDGVIGRNQLLDILKEHGYIGENDEILSLTGEVIEPGKEEQNEEPIQTSGEEPQDPPEQTEPVQEADANDVQGEALQEVDVKPLEEMNNKELRAVAKDLKVKGYSQMTNDKLIEAIKAVKE
jgi:hypothetical protein